MKEETTNTPFKAGDFIKYTSYSTQKVTFAIFEGCDLTSYNNVYAKKYSLACFYDSYCYQNNLNNDKGWGYVPKFFIASDNKACDKTIDTLKEDRWWSLCDEEEIKNAHEVLATYGVKWDEENKCLVNLDTGEIVYKLIIPRLKYDGEEIAPINEETKHHLILATRKVIKDAYPHYGDAYRYGYGAYDD